MHKKLWNLLLTLFFFLLTGLLLTCPRESLAFALSGLNLWFEKMIPSLLPFMILSGIMVRMNLTEGFAGFLSPLLSPLLRISQNGCYAVLMGFLCGFPMGARVTADLYTAGKIGKEEASYLLSFNNNIGPVYFLSFVLPTLGLKRKLPYLLGMYGLPFVYGLLLRRTAYKGSPSFPCGRTCSDGFSRVSLAQALDSSVMSGLRSIAALGGYMILFNLLNILFLPRLFKINGLITPVLSCLLEITGGIGRLFAGSGSVACAGNAAALTVLVLLPFGGLCCIAQTWSMIQDTGLSIRRYIVHKLALTGLTAACYGLWFILSPATFLL